MKRKGKNVLTFVTIILVVNLLLVGLGCGNEYGDLYNKYPNPNPNAYVHDEDSVNVAEGGVLKAFAERQEQGKLSQDTLSVRYFLRNTYTGKKKVVEIKATWQVKAQFRRQTNSSFDASIGIGADSVETSVGGSSSVEYKDIHNEKYYTNKNGSKEVYYGPSNYTLYPYKQVNSQSFSNTAFLKIKGHATPFSITAVV